MPSIVGRMVVDAPTNKSGGALAKGDVVVVDTANDHAVTTTTTGATTVPLGIVIEENGIANNVAGRVQFAGFVPLVNVPASVTRGHYLQTHTVAKQAVGNSSRQAGSAGIFTSGGTTPGAYLFGIVDGSTGSGGIPLSLIDAAGDLIAGSAADTAVRLAIGAAGGALSRVNGAVAWNSGTSFPTAETGDRYWRTDLGMEFYYNGTRWLCTCPHIIPIALQDLVVPLVATGTVAYAEMDNASLDLWIERIAMSTTVLTTNDGTKYWTVAANRAPSGTALGSSFTTAADTAGTNTRHDIAVGALAGTSDHYIGLTATKTSTPGGIYAIGEYVYRYVGA